MKTLIISILLFFILFACKPSASKNMSGSIEKVTMAPDWLVGFWKRNNDEPGKETYEQWSKVNDSIYTGIGFTMQQKDTIWKEVIVLSYKDTVWSYNVNASGNTDPVSFVFTNQTDTSFTCENAQNEFPKKISYRISGDQLKANISGGGQEVDFIFAKHH